MSYCKQPTPSFPALKPGDWYEENEAKWEVIVYSWPWASLPYSPYSLLAKYILNQPMFMVNFV